jgi:signal transduction histidine kinase
MVESHERSFPNTPIVFCGAPEGTFDSKPDSHFTGVWAVVQPEKTLIAALQLQPDTKHVVVVGGVGKFDRSLEAFTKESLRKYESRLEFTYFTNLDMPTLLQRLRQLPSKTIVYHTSIMEDSAGAHFIDSSQAAPLVANAANAPVFVMDDASIGRGTVGGDVLSWAADGNVAAGMALKILDGVKPAEIPIVRNNNVYLFDWRALRRWGFKESDLPPGSIVVFRELSIWERTRWVWISALLIILFLAAVATYLQYSRTQLKLARDAQSQLSGLLINAQEQERRRLASELHDDFSQRVALLVFGLGEVQDTVPNFSNGVKRKLQDLQESAIELGDDLHTVSHRLHSSTLDALGLVRGLNALCRDFAAGQNLEIDFSSQDVPTHVQPDVALCLFRIVQEALQNLKKHSGAARAQVNLRRAGNILFLFIHDEGKGVDVSQLNQKMGLGIGSMRGRVQVLGGQFEIHSEPGKGTTIEVWVPLETELTPTTSTA